LAIFLKTLQQLGTKGFCLVQLFAALGKLFAITMCTTVQFTAMCNMFSVRGLLSHFLQKKKNSVPFIIFMLQQCSCIHLMLWSASYLSAGFTTCDILRLAASQGKWQAKQAVMAKKP
jgi:hypothetical protein